MKSKGFTLVEMIAVLVVVTILFVVSFPPILNALKSTQVKVDESVQKVVTDSVEELLNRETLSYKRKDNNKYCVTINELIEKNYLKEDLVEDLDKETFVAIEFEEEKTNISFATECEQHVNDIYFVLNGDNTVKLTLGATYSEPGFVALDENGNNIADKVRIMVHDFNLKDYRTPDTSIVNEYVIEYELISGTSYVVLERRLIIDNNGMPVITHPGNDNIDIRETSYDIMYGVSAVDSAGNDIQVTAKTDLSLGIVGDYTITYTATDSSGNTSVARRIVNIEDTSMNYNEPALNGADPVLKDVLVPVTIADDGTVKKADVTTRWYSYSNKQWANAIILGPRGKIEEDGTIKEESIESYFVWIPRYKYKVFNNGEFNSITNGNPTGSSVTNIDIVFENKWTETSKGTEVGQYLTHPAFQSFDTNGIWVSKFEVSSVDDSLQVKPNQKPLGNISIVDCFLEGYNYERSMSSHLMKNTEWGAVALLSLSKYGINKEININNNTGKTGYSSVINIDAVGFTGASGTDSSITLPYNTTAGYKASTTGNITGVYDINGGLAEYVSGFVDGNYKSSGFSGNVNKYGSEYFDIYDDNSTVHKYSNRILGDATGEMGPFYNSGGTINNWFNDASEFIDNPNPWFIRGGLYNSGTKGGQLAFGKANGNANANIGFRIVFAR